MWFIGTQLEEVKPLGRLEAAVPRSHGEHAVGAVAKDEVRLVVVRLYVE